MLTLQWKPEVTERAFNFFRPIDPALVESFATPRAWLVALDYVLLASAPRGLIASPAPAEAQEGLQCQQGRESEAVFFRALSMALISRWSLR